jgi:hypothetical protein
LWEKILKIKAMGNRTKKLIDEVMDSTPRTVDGILDLMFEEMERKNEASKTTGKGRFTTSNFPTRTQLAIYLNRNYNSKPTQGKTKYWK